MDIRLKCTLLAFAAVLSLSTSCCAAQTDSNEPVPASHVEIEVFGSTPETKFENLVSFCMDTEGNLLACDAEAKTIRKMSPDGKTLAEWKFDFAPYAVDTCSASTIYAAGEGTVVKLDKNGRVVKSVKSDAEKFPKGKPSGISATKDDIFVAFGTGGGTGSKSSIIRFDLNLNEAEIIAEDLRGCCQRLDLVSKKNASSGKSELFIAENARHRVLRCDRNGEVLSSWGAKGRTGLEDFGSCCNPMNLCFGPSGELYTAESGLGRIKRYSPSGEFLGLVGYVGTARFSRAGRTSIACSNITVAVSKNASRIYVLDFRENLIRVMAKANPKPPAK